MADQAQVYQSRTVLGGRYLLGPALGRGGMAQVREGRDLKLERPVAVKLLRTDLASDASVRARFEGEARSAARLRHPHVVSVLDTGESNGIPFIVMELLPGDTLADRIRYGPLSEATVRRLASQVLGALDAAHSAGILHRDVKPANILFDEGGTAKVADFGIAKSMEADVATDLTTTGHVLGTLAYIAPERAEGKAAAAASDLWSLGVVLYEALTNRRPFLGDNALATALAARQGSMTPLSSLRPDLSPRLVEAVERALSPSPSDRFASAAAMAGALGVALVGAGPSLGLGHRGSMAAGGTGQLGTATKPLPAADPMSIQRLVDEPETRTPIVGKGRTGAHRRKRRSPVPHWTWLASGAAVLVLVTLVALAASGTLSGSSNLRGTVSGSAGNGHGGQSHSSGSTTPSTSEPPTTTTTTPAAPGTTAPATTAPSVSPPTTAPQPTTSRGPKGPGPRPHDGGQGDQGTGHGHRAGQGH